ncbi:Uncharacterised protein [Bordetella pertussis]|nr:Uncharacterised protein [Bordetella pertussis]
MRSLPSRMCGSTSEGFCTITSTCPPSSAVTVSLPDLYDTCSNLPPVRRPSSSSARLLGEDGAPKNMPLGFLAASTRSCSVLYGESARTVMP